MQRVIRDEGLLDRGQYLRDRLEECLGQHRCIGDIRGRGLLMALELVAERNAKTPFDPALKMHSRRKAAALERGLLVYPGGGTIDGRRGDHVLLAPPYNVTEAELDVIIDRLTLAVDSTIAA